MFTNSMDGQHVQQLINTVKVGSSGSAGFVFEEQLRRTVETGCFGFSGSVGRSRALRWSTNY